MNLHQPIRLRTQGAEKGECRLCRFFLFSFLYKGRGTQRTLRTPCVVAMHVPIVIAVANQHYHHFLRSLENQRHRR